ncbi:transposase, degenerate [Bacillus cereus E33L]|uniref:Transposase, degenerate n=1 Tax=Bacillus cereus (strain ZK / E33L) TaxID=288681 RepID=Q63CZ1_BACCZ|nr:transposase, degenerate [Bacillus cereus E33L]
MVEGICNELDMAMVYDTNSVHLFLIKRTVIPLTLQIKGLISKCLREEFPHHKVK